MAYKFVNADQLDADLTTVADAIRAKGETTGTLSFPEGMAEAVTAISTGVEVQIVNGTFTTTSDGLGTITLDFAPDLLVVSLGESGTVSGSTFYYMVAFPFQQTNWGGVATTLHAGNSSTYTYYDIYALVSNNNRTCSLYIYGDSTTVVPNKRFSYTAVKYT